MAWLRMGDNVTTHPVLFRLLEVCDGDIQLRNEAWGVLTLVASISAQHLTDYVVAPGMVSMNAPGRGSLLTDIWVEAGLAERIEVDGRPMIRLVEDEEVLHMRTKQEVTIDRLRKADGRRPDLMIPVRVRDGDQCRWCGKTVKWGDQKSGRGATIDSLNGHVDSTVDTLVVSCRDCNTKRGNGIELTLRPAPSTQEVYYSDRTITYINESEWARENGITVLPKQLRLDLPSAATQTDCTADAPTPVEDSATASGSEAPGTGADSGVMDSAAQGSDEVEDTPAWVLAPESEVLGRRKVMLADAPTPVEDSATASGSEAPGTGADSERHLSEVQDRQAFRPTPVEDSATASGSEAPGTGQVLPKAGSSHTVHTSNIEPELSRDLDQRGDGSGFVGSGRDGSGRAGPGRHRKVSGFGTRRRRGGRGKGLANG